jgi:lipoprotein-releasing system ATP-binding protein
MIPTPPTLIASHLQKTFIDPVRIEILKDVSLEAAQGETIAIMGRSGEGKSTLLHLIGALETPTAGQIKIAGIELTTSNAARIRNRYIGYIFQAFHLLEDDSVLENVLMPAKIARLPTHKGSPQYLRAIQLIELVGLTERIHFPTKLLSGGEKQRVAIARALCNDPNLILADEPSGNLDRANSKIIHSLLIRCAREFNKTLIVVTHDEELAGLCDRVLRLKEGCLYCKSPDS